MAKKSRSGLVIIILIIIVLILLGIILYSFVIKPSISGYVLNKQIEAKDATLNTILLQIQQQGYAQISDNQGNTIILVPYNVQQVEVPEAQAE